MALVTLTACGRFGFDDTAASPDAAVVANGSPQLCDSKSWNTVTITDPDLALSVVETPAGVTAVWVAKAGSELYGINLGTDWAPKTNPAGTLIKIGTWRQTAITYIDGGLITGVAQLDRSDVKIDLVQPDLSGSSENACPIAAVISTPPMLHAGADLVAPVTSDIGMTVIPFDSSFSSHASMLSVVSTNGPTDMTATTVGSSAVVAWSTGTGCFVAQLMDMATGNSGQNGGPCAAPRLAASGSDVMLLFERPNGIYGSRGAPLGVSSNTANWLAAGTAPRIVFDGQQFWISYRDATGHVVAGYLAPDGTLRVTTTTIMPKHDAYDLVLVRGQPWVFAAGFEGLSADRLCVVP